MSVGTLEPEAPVRSPTARSQTSTRQVWLADGLRWCRRNQVPGSIRGLRRATAAAAALVVLAGGAALILLAVVATVVVGGLTGHPGDLRAMLPWFLLAASARSVLLGPLPSRRAAVARPADADALDALELTRAPVWRARVLLPGLLSAVATTVVALATILISGSP